MLTRLFLLEFWESFQFPSSNILFLYIISQTCIIDPTFMRDLADLHNEVVIKMLSRFSLTQQPLLLQSRLQVSNFFPLENHWLDRGSKGGYLLNLRRGGQRWCSVVLQYLDFPLNGSGFLGEPREFSGGTAWDLCELLWWLDWVDLLDRLGLEVPGGREHELRCLLWELLGKIICTKVLGDLEFPLKSSELLCRLVVDLRSLEVISDWVDRCKAFQLVSGRLKYLNCLVGYRETVLVQIH